MLSLSRMKKAKKEKETSLKKILLPLRKFFFQRPFLGIFIIVLSSLFYFFILRDLPLPTRLSSSSTPQSSQIFDRNGKLLYTIFDKKNQTFIPLSQIPQNLQNATIAIEDKGFYQHGAVDIRGIARAFVSTVFHQQIQGGSTLTQQLVKNSLLTQEQTIPRKVKEIILAFATELIYSKKQILEMYLNQTPYGGTAYGVEAASELYFGKPAKNLDLAESALLAGLPQSPTQYSPFGSHPEEGRDRQIEVLKAMQEQGYISKDQEQKAMKETLDYKRISNSIQAPHFVLFIKDLLTQKYGDKVVEEGGLKVITTLDLDLQNAAQASVAAEINDLPKYYRVSNGAAMVVQPGTGEILAMVGSKDYFDSSIDGNVNVPLSLRQPGSSIKPINYAAGIANGYTAATPFIDEPTCFPNQGGKEYCPVNYDGKFHGVVEMRTALANSFNIPAVKMLKANGISTMIATASAMGISTFTHPEKYGLSLTLGGAEVSMYEMMEAYSDFANQGYRIPLQPILKVTDKNGKTLENYTPPASPIMGKRVLPEGVAYIISDILSDNNARALEFGEHSSLYIPGQTVAVKTGTTNDIKDNWTFGYTPSYVVGTWVGNNDNSPMSGLVSGITGAAPIWHDIMSYILENKPVQPFDRPSNIVQKSVCSDTGALPDANNKCPTRMEYFIKGKEPVNYVSQKNTWVDKNTQDLPAKGQTDNLELKDVTLLTDPVGDQYCLSCPHPSPSPSPSPTPAH